MVFLRTLRTVSCEQILKSDRTVPAYSEFYFDFFLQPHSAPVFTSAHVLLFASNTIVVFDDIIRLYSVVYFLALSVYGFLSLLPNLETTCTQCLTCGTRYHVNSVWIWAYGRCEAQTHDRQISGTVPERLNLPGSIYKWALRNESTTVKKTINQEMMYEIKMDDHKPSFGLLHYVGIYHATALHF